ncbi:MAG TPA: hypothetical protein DDX92_00420 [Flavobacteriales bacterium]|nr:hypothetical protein [Flavobacteriales bacterium]
MNDLNSFRISIAVLPFRNLNTDTEHVYFCEGITEEIINALSNVDQLRVISKTSSFSFQNKSTSTKEIAEKLRVDLVVEGSVRISGEQLRIAARLTDPNDESLIWTQTWNRKLENLFDIQDEISLYIADRLREQFGHLTIKEHLAETPTRNLTAYEHFLHGKKLFNKWNPVSSNESIQYFEKALRIDNQLIDAYTGLADAYSFLAIAGFAPYEEAWQKAIDSLEKAKKIDSENASLNYLLANHAFFTEASFAKAFEHIQKALANKPNHSDSRNFISFFHLLEGNIPLAKEHLRYAKSIDPLNQETKFHEAHFLYRTGNLEDSKQLLAELLVENPMNVPAQITLTYALIKMKAYDLAQKHLDEIPKELMMPDERLGLE